MVVQLERIKFEKVEPRNGWSYLHTLNKFGYNPNYHSCENIFHRCLPSRKPSFKKVILDIYTLIIRQRRLVWKQITLWQEELLCQGAPRYQVIKKFSLLCTRSRSRSFQDSPQSLLQSKLKNEKNLHLFRKNIPDS